MKVLFNNLKKDIPKIMESAFDAYAGSTRTRWEDVDVIELEDGSTIDMGELQKQQRLAKAALSNQLPHVGILAEKLRFIYTFKVPTQATDGYNVFVNPEFTNNLSLEGKIFVMAHELMHCILNHVRRGISKGVTMPKGNIAADYEVNQTLVNMGLSNENFVKNTIHGYIDKKWSKIGFEEIYDKMEDSDWKSNQQPQTGDPGNNQNNSNQNTTPGQQGKPGSDQNQQGNKPGQQGQGSRGPEQQNNPQGQHQPGAQKSTKPKDGTKMNQDGSKPSEYTNENGETVRRVNPQDRQTGGQAGGGMEGQDDMINRSKGDQLAKEEGYDKGSGESNDEAQSKVWEKVASDLAKIAGNKPGFENIKIAVEASRVSDDGTWRRRLAKIVGRSISPESKRRGFTHQNTLASQTRLALTDFTNYNNTDFIGCFVDTSGSMSQDFLKACMMDVMKVADAKKPNAISVVQFDTKIQYLKTFRDSTQFKKEFKSIQIKGGGGTDVKDCFELYRFKKLQKPNKSGEYWPSTPSDLVLVFTDGYLDQYKRPNQLCKNLIWVVVGNPSFNLSYPEPNTSVIHVSKEQAQKYGL